MKTFITILIAIVLSGCQGGNQNNGGFEKGSQKEQEAVIRTKRGNINIKFLPTKAPNTVKRIKKLIEEKFYDGIQFHRVVPNFVIQAGDPTGTGVGGSGKNINAEFNDMKHVKGSVAMARLGHDTNSADSQFYIALSTLPHLDNKYTIFAIVSDGIEVLDRIKKGDKIESIRLKD